MNNRTQQRFDKSIREAVETTRAAKALESAAKTAAKKRRYALEIPRIEALIERGATTSGRVLTKPEINDLRDMLDFRKKVVGTCA